MPTYTQPVSYTFEEISLGIFSLKSHHINRPMTYTLTLDNGCGEPTLIVKDTVTKTTALDTPTVIFKNLKAGEYTLTITFKEIPQIFTLDFKTYSKLECSVLEGIEDLFVNCDNCIGEVDAYCLLSNIITLVNLYGIKYDANLFQKFRCLITSTVDCKVYKESGTGGCDKQNNILIAYYYILMYNNRDFLDKKERYNYNKIRSYIVANIVNLR